jgi:hypothetical protein
LTFLGVNISGSFVGILCRGKLPSVWIRIVLLPDHDLFSLDGVFEVYVSSWFSFSLQVVHILIHLICPHAQTPPTPYFQIIIAFKTCSCVAVPMVSPIFSGPNAWIGFLCFAASVFGFRAVETCRRFCAFSFRSSWCSIWNERG